MDVAAFKVCHSVDTDATALRAARVRSKSIGAMDDSSRNVRKANTLPRHTAHKRQHTVSSSGQWNVTCVGSIRRKTHVALPRYTANSEHTIGAMERYTVGSISRESSPPATHNMATVSKPVGRWMIRQGKFKR